MARDSDPTQQMLKLKPGKRQKMAQRVSDVERNYDGVRENSSYTTVKITDRQGTNEVVRKQRKYS